MTMAAFLLRHIIFVFVANAFYSMLLFRCVGQMGLSNSRCVLWGLVVGCCAWGISWQHQRYRNDFRVFCNVALAFGSYAVITYMALFPARIGLILAISVALAAGYVALIQVQPMDCTSPARRRLIRIRRIERSVAAVHATLSLGLFCILALFVSSIFFGAAVLNPAVEATDPRQGTDQTIAVNEECLLLLEESRWRALSVRQRLDVMQTVANVECGELGLPGALTVGADDLGQGVYGCYDDQSRRILLDLDMLREEPSCQALITVCHEAFHSYQHRMIDVYDQVGQESRTLQFLRDAGTYRMEFGDYQDGEEDFEAYEAQACETDARSYALYRLTVYTDELGLTVQTEERDGT